MVPIIGVSCQYASANDITHMCTPGVGRACADGISFPHRVEPGAANRSFGIEVARLAGLPPPILERARAAAAALAPLSAAIARRLDMPPPDASA